MLRLKLNTVQVSTAESGKEWASMLHTLWCDYNIVNILQNIHERCPILWVLPLIDILPQFLQWSVQYHVILDHVLTTLDCINLLGPIDAIWRPRSRSALAQVMACCLKAPSHYLNQCWFITQTVDIQLRAISQKLFLTSLTTKCWKSYMFENTATSPRAQWVKYFIFFFL